MSLLKWALIMLVVSLVAALFGFTGLSAASGDVARVLFVYFHCYFPGAAGHRSIQREGGGGVLKVPKGARS